MSTSSAGICPDCAAVGFKRLGCETCRGMGMVPTPTAQPEPRTPDETLAALTREWRAAVGDDPDDDIDVDRAVAAGDALVKRLRELAGDKARMDWLERQVVNVREPTPYGSLDRFWSSPPDDEDGPSDLRRQVDAARAAQPTEGTDA